MNTRTRRFVLRLIVGILTFLIGVAAAMTLGSFHPLDGHRARVRVHRCGDYAHQAPEPSLASPVPLPPASVYPVESRLIRTPLPPTPQAVQPVPVFEDEGELKSSPSVAPAHSSR